MDAPLLVLTGPTASGKTEVAVMLAGYLGGGEVISADSRQIYRYLDVGTAKPSAPERSVRHHLLDIRDPDQRYSAGEFAVDARRILGEVGARGVQPIVVGGSGLYVQALLDGLTPVDPEQTRRLRVDVPLAAGGAPEQWHAQLQELDPAAARRIDPHDGVRLSRALEHVRLGLVRTGRWRLPLALRPGPSLVYCCLAHERDALYARIDRRAAAMVEHGLLEEAAALRARGFRDDCPGLQTMGYPDALACLDGRITRSELLARLQRATRQYAKRQLTWCGRDRRLRWLRVDRLGPEGCVERIAAQLRRGGGGAGAGPGLAIDGTG